MLQFHPTSPVPSLADVARLFGLAPTDLDVGFGIINTDPEPVLFTAMSADQAVLAAQRALSERAPPPAEAIVSNPRVEPLQVPLPQLLAPHLRGEHHARLLALGASHRS